MTSPAVAAESSPAPPGAFADVADVLDSQVREQLDRTGVPGAAYAVVGPGGIEHSGTFGHDGDGAPITTSTRFLWGSVSKPVTASLVVMLSSGGRLDLDDAVVDLVPRFGTADPRSARPVTVRDLLAHTSGLSEGLELTDRYQDDRSLSHLLDQIADLDPVTEPGGEHSYSSLNYVVLAAVVEAVTGQRFEQALNERLLAPAGMNPVPIDPREAEESLPAGHRYVLGQARPFTSHIDPAARAAGYLTGSIDDLATFAQLNLTGTGLLDSAELGLLHTRDVATWPDAGYALGWRTGSLPDTDEPTIWHAGAAPGYQSAIILLPEQDRAVVVLQNAYGPFHDEALLDVSWRLAALVADRPAPRDHGTDPLYVAMLVTLGVLLALLAGAASPPILRLLRHQRPGPRGGRHTAFVAGVWVVTATAVAIGLLAIPGLLGVTLGQVQLWAPDISWLLHIDLALTALVALLRLADAVRTSRSDVGQAGWAWTHGRDSPRRSPGRHWL